MLSAKGRGARGSRNVLVLGLCAYCYLISAAFFSKPSKTACTCGLLLSRIPARAINRISCPERIWSSSGNIAVRSTRLARLRCTAIPTARPAATATRSFPKSLGRLTNTTNGCATDFPSRRTRLKSAGLLRRNPRFTYTLHPRSKVEQLGVPIHFLNVIGRDSQFVATLKAATTQNVASGRTGHSAAEPMHARSAAYFGLISSLGHLYFSLADFFVLTNG
jgi:hypothetical protein